METYLTQRLDVLIVQAYKLFRTRPPENAGVCTDCCMRKIDEARLIATPVRNIQKELIEEWLNAAFTTTPSETDAIWLLPRLMELVAQDIELNTAGAEVTFRRIGDFRPVSAWQPKSKALFEEFAIEVFQARLLQADPRIDETLCMFSNAGMDMSPLLYSMEAMELTQLARSLSAELTLGFNLGTDAFWENALHRNEVSKWISQASLSDRLLEAAFLAEGRDELDLFRAAELTLAANV